MGPARALEEREKFKKKHTIHTIFVTYFLGLFGSITDPFFKKHFFFNHRFCPPDNVFGSSKRVLQASGRNTPENAYKITSKSKFSTPNVQIPYHLHPALSYSLISRVKMSTGQLANQHQKQNTYHIGSDPFGPNASTRQPQLRP